MLSNNQKIEYMRYYAELIEKIARENDSFYNLISSGNEFHVDSLYDLEYNYGDAYDYICDKYNIEIKNGATRMVIISLEKDFICKIDFDDRDINFCKKEADNYQNAIVDGIDELFAECYDFPIIFDNIYLNAEIMEKVEVDEEKAEDYSYKIRYQNSGLSLCDFDDQHEILSSSEEVEVIFQEILDYDKYIALNKFVYDYDIDDIHTGNIGFLPDGRIKITDYAGFCY